jgi:hypothetical protein
MKSTLLLPFILLIPFLSPGQFNDSQQYFDGADTLESSLVIEIDTTENNIWQIGPPQKSIFDSAATFPNVIVTDTINNYPPNNVSSFSFELPFEDEWQYGIFAVQWMQKLDMDHGHDGGIVEFSLDSGNTWHNAATSPYVYNYYGFEEQNLDTLWNDQIGFTGVDSAWKDVWFCLDASFMVPFGGPLLRFTFTSDSLENDTASVGGEGWMMDNFLAHFTFIHTVDEEKTTEYLEIHPNPTNGRVNISARQLDQFHIIEEIEVLDMSGKRLKYFETLPVKTFIDLNDLPKGAYLIRIRTNLKTEVFRVMIE